MAQDQTVVDHLLLGRRALTDEVDLANSEIEQLNAEVERQRAEVERLSAAIMQLDSVIGLFGPGGTPAPAARTTAASRTTPAARADRSAAPAGSGYARSGAPAKRTVTRARTPSGQAPKSIRVHVLEMLAAEDREWSLAEIIDRIHGAGIQAHDDAVRSITIKLMKDGRVERVGRGQYRLARRGSARSSSPTLSAATSPVTPRQSVEEPHVEAVSDAAPVNALASDPDSDPAGDTFAETETVGDPIDTVDAAADVPETVSTDDLESGAVDEPGEPGSTELSDESYTPPLNLGQPWS